VPLIGATSNLKETDLIYEGIATFPRINRFPFARLEKETDLIYEGIATP